MKTTAEYGSWDNSRNYYTGHSETFYGCRTQNPTGSSSGNTDTSSDTPYGYHSDGTTLKCPSGPSRWGNILPVGKWGNLGEWCKDGSANSSCETFARNDCKR